MPGLTRPWEGKPGAPGPLTGGKLADDVPVPKLVGKLDDDGGEAKGLGFDGG